MRQSYLAIVGDRPRGFLEKLSQQASERAHLSLILRTANLLVLADPGIASLAVGDGIVLGSVYGRDFFQAKEIPRCQQDEIIESDGKYLVDHYWGSYIAIWPSAVGRNWSVEALRAPMGEISCYRYRLEDLVFLTNDVRTLECIEGIKLDIDWNALTTILSFSHFRPPNTAIKEVLEIGDGTRLSISAAGVKEVPLWTPWAFVEKNMCIENMEDAAADLRSTIVSCVSIMTKQYPKVLVGVSGGLDSSIVAACLTEAGIEATCFTLVTADPAGDERRYAEALTEHLGLRLTELFEDPALIDLERSDAACYPRPVARAFAQSGDRLQERLAEKVGAEAYFTGAGGDNVFAYIPSVSPVADRLLVDGVSGGFSSALDMSRMTGINVQTVLFGAMKRAFLRGPAYRWPKVQSYLTHDARLSAEAGMRHSWLGAPKGALPGKAAHIAWLLGIQNHLEGFGRQERRPLHAPLLAQPVVELCLRIPSWFWCLGGRNREIARRAFSNDLPRAILERRSKGSPDGLSVALFDKQRPTITRILLEGELAKNQIIDRVSIEKSLMKSEMASDSYHRLLALVDVETWARSWL